MSIITIGVALFVGLILVLIISSLNSRSRNTTGHRHQPGDDVHGMHHAGFPVVLGQAENSPPNRGDWNGRDMSSDHHSHSDAAGGGDWGGGDAGGASGGGGGE